MKTIHEGEIIRVTGEKHPTSTVVVDKITEPASGEIKATMYRVDPAVHGGEGALSYGQKLIAEAIEAHFGERNDEYDEDVDDTANHDAWEAFDALVASRRSREGAGELRTTLQFWLAELDQYGNPRLCDGSHDTREGVEQAAYLLARLGLKKDRIFACAEVRLTEVEAKPHDANEDALNTLNSIGLRP